MDSAKAQAAVAGLWKACETDLWPTEGSTITAFLFDRCTEWSKLLGLWQGVVKCMIGLPEEGDEEASMAQIRARVLREEAAMKARVQAAAEQGQAARFLVEVYTAFIERTGSSSGYWQWFNANLQQFEQHAPGPIQQGSVVRIHGLTGAKELNGAIGTVSPPPAGAPTAPSGRLPITLRSPAAAVEARPGGVLVRPANLRPLPNGASAAVLLIDFSFHEALAFDFAGAAARRRAQKGALPAGWRACQVSQMLGVPLALRQLTGSWPEHMARGVGVYLLADPITGIAPPDALMRGVGPVVVARTDGGDLTVQELADLHDYHMHLMDLWPDFESKAQRLAALTPRAYREFLQLRGEEFVEEDMDLDGCE